MEYRELKKLNQSLLKKILVSPKAYLTAKNSYENQTESVEDHFVFGTAVDIMLTGTKEEFDKKFDTIFGQKQKTFCDVCNKKFSWCTCISIDRKKKDESLD